MSGTSPRNHYRTSSPPNAKPPAPAPPPRRPIMLATPSQGYPFPVMTVSESQESAEPAVQARKKVTVQVPAAQQQPRSKEGDGWDTPDQRPSGMTRVSSTFSSGSSDGTPSTSSCETPDDEDDLDGDGVGTAADDESIEEALEGDQDERPHGRADELGGKAVRAPKRVHIKQSRPTTPAEMVFARTKHAGTTPGAPPPAPFYHPDFDHPSDSLLDRDDVRDGSESPEAADASSPRRISSNRLSNRVSGLTLTDF